jgi:hypothetical protein
MKAEFQRQLVFTNDFKILFCNAYDALRNHQETCQTCRTYIMTGDGDLCDAGKSVIKKAMVLQDEPHHK